MVPREHIIENPLSGEQITIRRTSTDTGGAVLEWELLLAPGGRVPSSHAHPEQEEVFTRSWPARCGSGSASGG